MFSLKGKKALVTGSSSGIGISIARYLSEQGAEVIITGRNEPALKQLQTELPGPSHIIVADLGKISEREKLVSKSLEIMGKVEILVNNAGITQDQLFLRMKQDQWDQVIDLNLTACYQITHMLMKQMMKNRWGRIINISSIVGVTGNPGQTNYCAAKAGLIGFSKALAHEIASRNITVNCIAPGYIETKMTEGLPEGAKEASLSKIPCKKIGSPDDIAAACVYLASEEANYITGQTLHINGGMAMI